jgi:hypothetical protein
VTETKRGRGRPRKDDPATPDSIRFTKAQRAAIHKWQADHEVPTFAGAVHALIARGLGE